MVDQITHFRNEKNNRTSRQYQVIVWIVLLCNNHIYFKFVLPYDTKWTQMQQGGYPVLHIIQRYTDVIYLYHVSF